MALLDMDGRMSEAEERLDEADVKFDAVWACINQLTRVALTTRNGLGDMAALIDVSSEPCRCSGGQLNRDVQQMQRVWVAVAKKTELFSDDEFVSIFGGGE